MKIKCFNSALSIFAHLMSFVLPLHSLILQVRLSFHRKSISASITCPPPQVTSTNHSEEMDRRYKLLISFLFLTQAIDGQRALFWRRDGKNLSATPIKTVKVRTPEDCIAICVESHHCKAVNVNHISMMCELLAVDRCNSGLTLMAKRDTSYFDLVAEGQCLCKYLMSHSYFKNLNFKYRLKW